MFYLSCLSLGHWQQNETNAEQFGSVPLWTLRYEVLAYIGTLGVFSLGLLRKKWMVLLQFAIPSIVWMVATLTGLMDDLLPTFQNLLRFGIAYGLGATIYAYRDRLHLSWVTVALLAAGSYLLRETAVVEVIINVVLAWVVFRFAYMRLPKFEWMQRIPDLSYGIYIYHWCILQMMFYWFPKLNVYELIALAFPPTVILAALSWYIVEKPALRSKTRCADWLRNIGFKPKATRGELLAD